jgi:hypothetical protein
LELVELVLQLRRLVTTAVHQSTEWLWLVVGLVVEIHIMVAQAAEHLLQMILYQQFLILERLRLH